QQGWRDAAADDHTPGHGAVDASGAPLRPPVALAQVGALAWRALVEAVMIFGTEFAVAEAAAHAAFTATFVADTIGRADDNPVALARGAGGLDWSATSDLGQVLWTGIVDRDTAARIAARLEQADLATAFGFRTLSRAHVAFSPHGYHTGAVWPFD